MKMSNRTAFNENGHLENVLLFIIKWLLFSITRPCDIQKATQSFLRAMLYFINLWKVFIHEICKLNCAPLTKTNEVKWYVLLHTNTSYSWNFNDQTQINNNLNKIYEW